MLLKKRLIVDGGAEPTAVLINDEGEEYPVFLESLHNTVILPELMKSGYTLTSLPYGFVKDGVSFDQLPVENYTPTDVETELMYNSIGVKMNYDDIKAYISVSDAVGLPTPPTEYTIHTREELISYLSATAMATLDDDFLPLNYFVAPDARFDIKEYLHSDNHKWVELITKRREMTLVKFHKLVAWLREKGLIGANYTAIDVLDAYFSWGFDGLKFTPIAKRRENRPFRLSPSKNVNAQVTRKTQGLIDGAGNMLTPMNERDVAWKLPSNDPNFINEATKGLGVNDTRVIEYKCNATQDVTVLEGPQFNIQYSTDTVVMQMHTFTPIRVKSPTTVNEFIQLTQALPNHIDELWEFCALQALARMLFDKRKPKVHTSSYKALTSVGANPETALNYVITKYDMNKEKKVVGEDEAESVPPYAVEEFLQGKEVSDYAKGLFDDIMSGVFNIDNVGSGKSLEAMVSTQSTFNELYALHNVMGISLEDIFKQIRDVSGDDKTIVFSNGQYQHVVDVSVMKMSTNGYLTDVQSYDIQCADECSFFTYVTLVAREVGCDNCDRHVGIEFYMVNRSHKQVAELLEQLVAMYEEKVSVTLADVVQQAKALRMKNVFALSRFFEIALKGTITWSKQLGGETIVATAEQRNTAKAHLETKIENLTAYCGFTVNAFSAATLSFNAYCVNAYCTPTYVIPRSPSVGIPEIPFYTAWMDLAHTNRDFYAQMIGMQVLPIGFVSWSERYLDQQFIAREYIDPTDVTSLFYCYNNAVSEVASWSPTEVFTAVTHPVEYMFPGIVDSEEVREQCAPREGAPVVRFGLKREITMNDYRDKLYPSTDIPVKMQYIRQFRGFSAEAYMLLGADVFSKLPPESGAAITILPTSESVYLADIDQVRSFTCLSELSTGVYPIVNVYDRIYLVRAADGRIWEARI